MNETIRRGLCLYYIFATSMLTAFTGGMVAMPIIERYLVEKKHWMSEREFWDYPAIGQTLPGVVGVHNAIFIGNHVAGRFGSVMAAAGVITTAFTSMMIVGVLFQSLVNNPYVFGAIRGIRVVAGIIILGVAGRLFRNCDKTLLTWCLILAGVIFPLVFRVSAFYLILFSGAVGIISMYLPQGKQE